MEGRALSESLSRRSPIFRLTALYNGMATTPQDCFETEKHGWHDIVHRLESTFRKRAADPAGFEEDGFALLLPVVKPGINRDLKAWPWVPQGYSTRPLPEKQIFGCFACEWSSDRKTLFFHFANACLPESPFKDIENRRREIRSMLGYALRSEPQTDILRCNSWLNSFPPFQSLFPSGYPRPGRVAPVGTGYNWWGQFMARDGGFHEKNGRRLRETGKFPYPAIDGFCLLRDCLA